MDVRGEIFCRIEQPQKSLTAHARGRFSGAITGRNLSVPGPLVEGPDCLLDLRISDYQEPPTLHVSPARGTHACLQDLADQFARHRVRFQPPHRPGGPDDLEQISAADFVKHGVSWLVSDDPPRLSDGIAWCKHRFPRTISEFAVAEGARSGVAHEDQEARDVGRDTEMSRVTRRSK